MGEGGVGGAGVGLEGVNKGGAEERGAGGGRVLCRVKHASSVAIDVHGR